MFRFKQFSVDDTGASMKVGTDAVLLGAMAGNGDARHVLDIGTGCGVVALIMAQRCPSATIYAIDNDAGSIACCKANFARSPWSDRLSAQLISVQEFSRDSGRKYDCIVSNPPFFHNSLKSPSEQRTMARHDDSLPPDELAAAAKLLLSPDGTFSAILPCPETETLLIEAQKQGLFLHKNILVLSTANRPIRRIVTLGHEKADSVCESTITIHNADGSYTEQYRLATEDLYLWEK